MPKPKRKSGFSLIEIVLAVLFISFMVVIILSASGIFSRIHRWNLQSIAIKIASGELEKLRKTPFANLPSTGAITTTDEPDLTKLPQGAATRTVTDYQTGDTKLKQVIIEVTWQESGFPRSLKTASLISEYGL